MNDGGHRPLDGLRVVDLSGMVSGGFATSLLGEFGADVIFVEHPEIGDPIRDWPPFENGTSLWWKALARNKRCVTIDLKTDDGRAIALDLVGDADVVVENFRPGTLERWGLGYDELREVNEGIILTRFSGYGQTGPRSEKPGFGTVAEGYSGWAHTNGFPDRGPLLPPVSIADLTAAQFGVMATMFAIFERDLGGDSEERRGQVIDVSLYEPLFRLFVGDVEKHQKKGITHDRHGNRHPYTAPRNIYETADGHMTMSASSQAIFENVASAMDREDLIDDPRFENNDRRVENVEALDEIIESWTCERSTTTAIREMEAADAIVGPVYDIEDIKADEQYRTREDIIEIDDQDVGRLETHNVVPKLSRTPGGVDFAGPRHGEHTKAVLVEELGLTQDEFRKLRVDGVV